MTKRKRTLRCPTSSAHKEWLAEATEKSIWLMDEHGNYDSTQDVESALLDESAATWRCADCNEHPIVTEEPVPETETERLTRELAEARAEIQRMRDAAAPAPTPPEPETAEPIEVYVISFAPSYERSSVGGFEWFPAYANAAQRLAELVRECGKESDYRLFSVRFPRGMHMDEIVEFLDEASEAVELCDPPDPSNDLEKGLASWRARRDNADR